MIIDLPTIADRSAAFRAKIPERVLDEARAKAGKVRIIGASIDLPRECFNYIHAAAWKVAARPVSMFRAMALKHAGAMAAARR